MRQKSVLGALILLAGCAGPTAQDTGDFRIVGTTFHGSIWSESMESCSVLFQDGGHGFPVPGGSLWVFGDTFLGSRDAEGNLKYSGARSCTIAFLRDGERGFPPSLQYRVDDEGVADTPFEFLEGESWEKHRIWPGGGITLDGEVYLYYALIELTDGEPPWNFRAAGWGLARSDDPLGRYERLTPGGDYAFPIAASQVLQVGEWLYLYEAGEIDGRRGVVLARVRCSSIEDPAAYEFRGEGTWGRKEDASLLVEGVYGQVSVAWNESLRAYVMACSSDFFRPREVLFRTGEDPAGPFGDPVASFSTSGTQGEVALIYCTFLHPELFRDGGRVMVLSFCPMLKEGFANPEMVEIEIERSR